jgi:uncharacterized protein YecE (DUF72 family)
VELAMDAPAKFFVGTSGWIYKEWAGEFYAEGLKKGTELEYYSTQFNTVEINATFYRLPLRTTTVKWRHRTPAGFVFAVKGSRYISHMKRLKANRLSIRRFFERIQPLGRKCGPILWQLPPNLPFDAKRLDAFLQKLPSRHRYAVEMRHPSWYEQDETFAILRRYRMAHVAVSSLRMPMNLSVTTNFAYVRFHGLEGGPQHDYSRRELRPWADFARQCLAEGVSFYAYFNNDLNTRAPWNAKLLAELVRPGALRSAFRARANAA